MITQAPARRQPTKQRLLDAGVRLFAEKGFRETTVGEIEAAAGLEPRRGALYRHFPTKEALLQAALERHLQSLADADAAREDVPTGDVRAEALLMGRWLLGELDRERAIVRILEHDGDRLPELRDSFRRHLVDAGYVAAVSLARRWRGSSTSSADVEAATVALMGAVVNFRRSTWTFGATPLGIDEERFLRGWADLCALSAGALRGRGRPKRRSS